MLRERELKLELDPAAAQRIANWLCSRGAKRKPMQSMRSVYFDTDDFALRSGETVFRIRRTGVHYTQTIKQFDGRGAGLFDRPEWEISVNGFIPDLAAARGTGVKPLQQSRVSRSLHPVFEIENRRTIFELPGESGIALSIDRGRVIAGRRHRRFCEIEIESLDGATGALFRTARALAEIAPVRLGIHTKSDRGYALLQQNEARIFRAGHVKLSPEMPAQEAFVAIARDCLRQLAANTPATIEGTAEALHQMRVALRRLRACMSLFSELIDGTEAASIKTGLRWIGSCLGVARDLDVMAADLQQRRTGAVPPEILKRLDRKRRHAHDDVRQALQSPRFQSLLLDTVAWVESGNGSAPKGGLAKKLREQPVFARATEELGRRQRKLARDCTHLERLSPAERHALRIRAKRLRYAVEFFGDLFGGTKSAHRCKALLSALKELQSTLGDLNDIANRDRLMLEITAPADGELPGVTAAALYRPAARSARLLAAASDAGHRISKAKPFWH